MSSCQGGRRAWLTAGNRPRLDTIRPVSAAIESMQTVLVESGKVDVLEDINLSFLRPHNTRALHEEGRPD